MILKDREIDYKLLSKEHTSSDSVAREIALDHLMELPDYYTKLEKMENKE